MQRTILLIFMIITIVFGISSCQKETTVLDYPNVLLKVDITPGEEENQIAVFLYTTRSLMDYEVTEKGDNFKILELNNTIKTIKATELPIDGIEDIVENVRLIQVIQENNKENPLVTRLIFKILNPDVKLKIISQIQKVDVTEIQDKINSSPAAEAIAQTMHPPTNKINIFIVIGFWVTSLLGIAIYVIYKKIQKKKEPPVKHYIDVTEDDIEYSNDKENKKIIDDKETINAEDIKNDNTDTP